MDRPIALAVSLVALSDKSVALWSSTIYSFFVIFLIHLFKQVSLIHLQHRHRVQADTSLTCSRVRFTHQSRRSPKRLGYSVLYVHCDMWIEFRTSGPQNSSFCSGGQQMGKAVSKQKMAHWIVDVITMAYEVQGVPCPLVPR